MSKVHDQLRQHVDGADRFMTGFQIGRARTYKRKPPEWTESKHDIQRVLLIAFPQLHNDQRQRRQAARWAQVIVLYFHLGYTAKQVGEEIGVKTSTVTGVIRRTRLVAAGHRSNGSGLRGGKRGRPRQAKKMVFNISGTNREVCVSPLEHRV
jgi:hypothetical protein